MKHYTAPHVRDIPPSAGRGPAGSRSMRPAPRTGQWGAAQKGTAIVIGPGSRACPAVPALP